MAIAATGRIRVRQLIRPCLLAAGVHLGTCGLESAATFKADMADEYPRGGTSRIGVHLT